jgi:uncharacterized membrane protein
MFRNRNIWTLLLILILIFLPAAETSQAQEPVVQAVLFYSPTCGHCKIVIEEVLPELDARYRTQLQIYGVNTHTPIGETLYENFISDFEVPPENQVVPAILIGDQILIGSQQIPELLPAIIDKGLEEGGIPWPELKGLSEVMAGTLEVDAVEATTFPEKTTLVDKFAGDLTGNILAVIVLAGMVASLVYTSVNLFQDRGERKTLPVWLVPVLSILGAGVAAYLSYVEYTQVEAVCGPIGNCNAVQGSTYATLFGILPVGIGGLLGYLGIILAWLLGKLDLGGTGKSFNLILWGFTLLGLLFSIYLTFLEPFVIGATCLWCLSSAVIMTALFLVASRYIRID